MSFPNYPKRAVSSLNGLWQFTFSPSHSWADENVGSLRYGDLLSVPSAFDAMPAYNGKRGVGFYRRTFCCTPGRRGRLRFNAVGMYAKVFVDGQKLGEQYAAYTPFEVEVPASEKAERELVVMAGNRFDVALYPLHEIFFDFYAYGGIFRDVEFQELPEKNRIDWVGVETLDYRTGEIRVRVRTAAPANACQISVDNEQPQRRSPDETAAGEAIFRLTVADFTPWSPEHPELHTVTVDSGDDAMTVRFGIRQVAAAEGKILLNGVPVKLLGYCRHEAHPQYGPALPMAQLVADLQLLRDSGCNFVRGSHYQQDPRFLDLCDELGMLVFEESMGWGQGQKHFTDPDFVAAQLKQTADMIATSYNHPSVILRGFLNEGASELEESRDCYEQLIRLCRSQDPHRLVTYASNRELRDLFLEQVDVVCFNIYPGWYAEDRDDEKPLGEITKRIQRNLAGLKERGLANKPYIISEIGAGAIYGWRDPICAHWSEEYQREYLRIVCQEVVENAAIAGVALWQFCDCRTYRGAGALGRPRAFNNKGVVDEYRRPKLAFETVKEIFRSYQER
jgi:beta-glucuronidase